MTDSDKITIVLADEDALRRDGLAAVLQGTSKFHIVAQCPDGEAALGQIKDLRPDVAVVDLNLPKLHGIELVRRVRSEAPGTKVVILSGTTDDDIIREVVRAGGDGYLLKNGPARHLIDAISYVRDGGQYFSPQLRRDGLDRHLLEETPRVPRDGPVSRKSETPSDNRDTGDRDSGHREAHYEDPEERSEPRSQRDSRYGRRRPARRPGGEPVRFRERLREEAETENLGDRDYEILDMMAEGIRPILDRLEEIEGRVVQMETGDAPVPNDPRGWLSTQMADTFRDTRTGREVAVGRSVQELEARLPQLIEEAVTARFHNMAEKLQRDIEDTHVRTLETFVKNIQVKLVQRVSALETDMSKQAEAMQQLQEYSLRTEDNLSRLISGVDKLAQELPKRLQAPEVDPAPAAPSPRAARRRSSRSFSAKVPVLIVVVLAILSAAGFGIFRMTRGKAQGGTASPSASSAAAGAAPAAQSPAPLPLATDTKSRMQAAQEYTERKEYATAEDIYKQVLKSEPNNVDAMKALASVLYREDKIEESAAMLDKLPKN